MPYKELEGNVIGGVWRGQEPAKELIYFQIEGQDKWFRLEYTGDLMLERANYMSEKLKKKAESGSGIEVGLEYDELSVGDAPHSPATTFNLVSYIQIRV
ncbi:MAG: hypothetical protein ABW092_19760 [Candidatus Thiodiazotropha sp.]